jgi:hypothetical protein
MWILPTKKLQQLAYSPDSEGSNLESEEFCQTSESSLTWRGNLMRSNSWARKLKADSWMKRLFGRMLPLSRRKSFEERYISSLPDIHAKTLVVPEKERVWEGHEDKCGDTPGQLFLDAMLLPFSEKTSKATSRLDSTQSLVTWQKMVIALRLDYIRRAKLARHISENESSHWGSGAISETGESSKEIKDGLNWRTPMATEAGARVETLYTKDGEPAKPGERAYRKTPSGEMVLQSQTLNQQVKMPSAKNWATPQVMDVRTDHRSLEQKIKSGAAKKGGCSNLREQVHYQNEKDQSMANQMEIFDWDAMEEESEPPDMWPTTRASDGGAGKMTAEVTPGGFRMTRLRSGEVFGARLGEAVQAMEQWPTPVVGDSSGKEELDHWEERRDKKKEEMGINLHRPLGIALQQEERRSSIGDSSSQDNGTKKTSPAHPTTTDSNGKKESISGGQSDGQPDPDSYSMSGKPKEQSWSTPQCRDYKGPSGRALKGEATDLPKEVGNAQLNPTWVESIMLLPAGYTNIE